MQVHPGKATFIPSLWVVRAQLPWELRPWVPKSHHTPGHRSRALNWKCHPNSKTFASSPCYSCFREVLKEVSTQSRGFCGGCRSLCSLSSPSSSRSPHGFQQHPQPPGQPCIPSHSCPPALETVELWERRAGRKEDVWNLLLSPLTPQKTHCCPKHIPWAAEALLFNVHAAFHGLTAPPMFFKLLHLQNDILFLTMHPFLHCPCLCFTLSSRGHTKLYFKYFRNLLGMWPARSVSLPALYHMTQVTIVFPCVTALSSQFQQFSLSSSSFPSADRRRAFP